MIFSRLNYPVGRLAKETSILAIMADGRFELGVGAGDYPKEPAAWGEPYPGAATRVEALRETVLVLRRAWAGQPVTFAGNHMRVAGAGCLPALPIPPRVVVGAGASRRLIRSAAQYADEINVYAQRELVDFARGEIEATKRDLQLSVFIGWDRPVTESMLDVDMWARRGVSRVFFAVWHPFGELQQLLDLASAYQ